MEAGAVVWVTDKDGDEAWLLGEVISRTAAELRVSLIARSKNHSTEIVTRSRMNTRNLVASDAVEEFKYQGVELANNKLSKADREEGKDDDMITLPHLHEPAILHAIGERYDEGKIYTWTGPVLIAVNPFQRLPLYTSEMLESYRRQGLLRSQGMNTGRKNALGPHLFAIADLSYRQMMGDARSSQAILISGESGAGKTESTKYVMRYLTTLGTAQNNVTSTGPEKDQHSGDMHIMDRILQSNPILEAFGNARTLRNDNSSRFGKFIELGFSRSGSLLGAKVQTYLLEKVRLASHCSGERNYHIFYQLLRGSTEQHKKKYGFHSGDTHGLELVNFYHYTGQGGAPQLREFSDEEGFKYTLTAMTSLGWDDAKIDTVLSLVAGLLHLGQVTFGGVEDSGGQEIATVENEDVLSCAARFLGVSNEKLKTALIERILVTRSESVTIQLSPAKAIDSRDALAKTIYGSLFLWMVSEVNKSVSWASQSDVRSSIGVLDIFGFECFAVNSFEQLCINYTNEALQQQFNKFIFKLEQAEYEREHINWTFIEFPDNQDCLDTIQSKPSGVLTMLDDECRLGSRGNDKNWADRLYTLYLPEKDQTESSNSRLSATHIQKSKSIFCIRHFAGVVEYSARTGFLEKNKDEIPITSQTLFEISSNRLMKEIYDIQRAEAEEVGTGKTASRSKTVAQQFKEQLNSLMDRIEQTEPHYIRCLKPNDAAKPKLLTRKRLTEQLRYGGVLEAVRVARLGFPVRLDHFVFFRTYRMTLPSVTEQALTWRMEASDAQALCTKLLNFLLDEGNRKVTNWSSPPLNEAKLSRADKIRSMLTQPIPMNFPKTDIQLGKTKVFLRKSAHDALEAHRVFHQNAAAIRIQSFVRGAQKRLQYVILLKAAIFAQRFYRGCKGRERWCKIRQAAAGDLLTKVFRMLIVRHRFTRAKQGVILYQGLYRGYSIRRLIACIKIQTCMRMYKEHSSYRRLRSATISLQCRQRLGKAKNEYMALKREQKDIGKLKENNERLKLEMASLKAMLSAQAKEDANRLESEKELRERDKEISFLKKRISQLEAELEKSNLQIQRLQSELAKKEAPVPKDQGVENEKRHTQHREQENAPLSPTGSQAGKRSTAPNRILHESNQIATDDEVLMKLKMALEAEREARRAADGEVIKLRAKMSGVNLNPYELDALLPTSKINLNDILDQAAPVPDLDTTKVDENEVEDTDTETAQLREKHQSLPQTPNAQTSLIPSELVAAVSSLAAQVLPVSRVGRNDISSSTPQDKLNRSRFTKFMRSPSELLPSILRPEDEKEDNDVVAVGWKFQATNRKEREEFLRDEVHRFETKMKKFYTAFEEGIEVTMWQYNRTEFSEVDEFPVKGVPIQLQFRRHEELLVQAILAFKMKGGYFSNALSRHKVDKNGLEPLGLKEILEVKAGCDGYDINQLPHTGKAKPGEIRQSSLFLTLKASPTPTVSQRVYYLMFKSRAARNDLLMGLRALLADLQIHEGVGVSQILNLPEGNEILVPLSEVHQVLDFERRNYDRILLMMLQGSTDLKEKEDDLLAMRERIEKMILESKEKERIHADDSTLIMQLSKKLETLLMDNEDLREHNERLTERLVSLF